MRKERRYLLVNRGTAEETRTLGFRIRSPIFYPTELQPHRSAALLTSSRERQGDLYKIHRNYKWYAQRDLNS